MELSLKDLKELLTSKTEAAYESDYELEKPYTIKTVLGWYKGILTKETPKTLTLEDCSWVAQTKRFSDYVLDDNQVEEEEPFAKETKFIIERSSVIGGFRMPLINRKLK